MTQKLFKISAAALTLMFCAMATVDTVEAQRGRFEEIQPQRRIRGQQNRARLTAPSNCRVATSGVVAFESFNYSGEFMRHSHYSAVLNRPDGSRLFAEDSSFVMRPGLAGQGVSFESVNFPGYFLRHSNYALVLHKDDGRRQFAEDATFLMTRGLAGTGTSLEPINLPNHYVRHYQKRFRISKFERSRLFREDATLLIR